MSDHELDDVAPAAESAPMKASGAFSKRVVARSSESIVFEHVSLSIKVPAPAKDGESKGKEKVDKYILSDVSGVMRAGALTAIMGASGAGKTSLLNVLVGRSPDKSTLDGTLTYGGEFVSGPTWARLIGYVWQEDTLYPYLTVKETLRVAAKLRLAAPAQEQDEIVEAVMEELDLTRVKDTLVGNALRKGISGGEKKRLSVGVELLTNPPVLFADEPTSGLDAASALRVMKTLKSLAVAGRTVVATIHQPRSSIVELFDEIFLLSKGQVAYAGAKPVEHFEALGYPLPPRTNPADFYLDVLAPTAPSSDKLVNEWSDNYRSAYMASVEVSPAADKAKASADSPPLPSSWAQFTVLLWRASKNLYRDKMRTIVRGLQAVAFAIFVGFIFFDLGTDQVGILDRLGVLYFISLNQSMGSLFPVLLSFTEEKGIFGKERQAGYYRSVLPYYLSKTIVEFPTSLLPLAFGGVVYFIVGLRGTFAAFLGFELVIYLLVFTVEALGLFLSSISKDVNVAQAIAPVVIILFMLVSGYIINLDSLPAGISWLQHLSFFTYSYKAMVINEFSDATFYCTPEQIVGGNGTGICPITEGEQVIVSRGFDVDDYWPSVAILAAQGLLLRTLTALVLHFFIGVDRSTKLADRRPRVETA
jgi:ABC-type multidrug transport system ATPase subunit/ABC-type multidrug transport system permease subunit